MKFRHFEINYDVAGRKQEDIIAASNCNGATDKFRSSSTIGLEEGSGCVTNPFCNGIEAPLEAATAAKHRLRVFRHREGVVALTPDVSSKRFI